MSRRRILAVLVLIPVLVVGGFVLYLLNLAGELPWQEDPTPISAGITPFAGLPTVAAIATATTAPGNVSTPVPAEGTIVASPAAASPAAVTGHVFAIVPEQSEVRYVVRERIAGFNTDNDAVGKTSAVIGQIAFDDSWNLQPGSQWQVDLRTLESDKVRRDNDVKRFWLETDDFPIGTLTITSIQGLSGAPPEGQPLSVTITGDLDAHGVTKSVVWDATVTLSGNTLTGSAKTEFTFEDFGMAVPDIAGMVTARNPITLEFDFTMTKGS